MQGEKWTQGCLPTCVNNMWVVAPLGWVKDRSKQRAAAVGSGARTSPGQDLDVRSRWRMRYGTYSGKQGRCGTGHPRG